MCVYYKLPKRHNGLCIILRHRIHFHRRECLLLRVRPPVRGGHPGIRREIITGESTPVCRNRGRTPRDLFYGTVFRFHPVDDIADVLPEVFPGGVLAPDRVAVCFVWSRPSHLA